MPEMLSLAVTHPFPRQEMRVSFRLASRTSKCPHQGSSVSLEMGFCRGCSYEWNRIFIK